MYSKTNGSTYIAGFTIGQHIKTLFSNLVAAVKREIRMAHTYNELQNLSDEALRDVGISRDDIEYVAKYGMRKN